LLALNSLRRVAIHVRTGIVSMRGPLREILDRDPHDELVPKTGHRLEKTMPLHAVHEDRSRAAVAGRWGRTTTGKYYATARFATDRRRARDGRLVARLLARPSAEAHGRFGRVLDAPCGTGRLTDTLAPLTEQLVGLDVSRAMLTAAPEAFGGVARIEASVFALPFATATFDVVVACRLLHHFSSPEDRRAILGELARVTRRFVVLSYWDAASWHAWRRRAPGPFRRRGHDTRVAIAARTLDADLAAAGLTRIARAHSLRFVSPQTFVLAARRAE
jgi:SAM-dependent methyltransferase